MIPAADASFLVSLYGVDVNTPAARSWMLASATPLRVTDALRFETENALRLAHFRGRISAAELQQALAEIESDFALGVLVKEDLGAAAHWAECRRLSEAHTTALGARAYDITHVAGALLMEADVFLSFDQRQRTLAVVVGLAVAP